MASFAISEFGEQLVTKGGVKSTTEVLGSKRLIGIYFSAHWCPPCRGFTPVLADFYQAVAGVGADEMEIVFVSSDSDQASFDDYFGTMPWVALPFEHRDLKQKLGEKYGVRGIPSFIVLDAAGNVKDASARGTVSSNSDNVSAALSTWA
jgi:nucleoredoxin